MSAFVERTFNVTAPNFDVSNLENILDVIDGEKKVCNKNYISSGRFKLENHSSNIDSSNNCTIILAKECSGSLVANLGGQITETTVKPGRLVFSPAGEKQLYDFRGQTTNTIMTINKNLFDRVSQIDPSLGSFDTLGAIADWTRPKLVKLVEEQHRVLISGEMGWRVLSESIALRMACEILSAFNGNEAKKAGAPALTASEIARLSDFIDAEMENNFDLSELAMVLDRDPFGFSRSFKAATGESPHQYVIQRRLMQAKNLLTNTSDPLAEIAYACGFSSQPHMTSVFSKQYGISPGKWRKKVTA